MKKFFINTIIFFPPFFWARSVFAADVNERFGQIMRGITVHGEGAFDSSSAYAARNNPLMIAWYAAVLFLSFVGILVFIAFLYGGWMWMTSQGNAEKLARAQRILLQAAIGTFVVLSSLAVTYFVIDIYAAVTDNRYWRGGNTYYEL